MAILCKSSILQAQTNPLQFQLGDTVSIYSEKAYRRDNGTYFEAVGNVVILSGDNTIYGEKASFNTKSGEIYIEGSVRFVGQNFTMYGTKVEFNAQKNLLVMYSARMITPEFSIVSTKITRKAKNKYEAYEAEFTTCRDCTESWQVYGKNISIDLGEYVQIFHALIKVKGIDVLYIPYIALPIKDTRESGLLFPLVSTRNDEGIYYQQPFFLAISDDKDMTITPSFLSQRGYGSDIEYRQSLSNLSWFEVYNKSVFDTLYVPNAKDDSEHGSYFRHFTEVETHFQPSHDLSSHLRVIGTKDLDFYSDYNYFTNEYVQSNDMGMDFSLGKRFDTYSLSLESHYKRNLLDSNPLGFDSSYVQTLPKIKFSTLPHLLYQSKKDYFYNLNMGIDADYTMFKQNRIKEDQCLYNLSSENKSSVYTGDTCLRNAGRLDAAPYISLGLLNKNGFVVSSRYTLEYQAYDFLEEDEVNFYKHAGLISTEFSFTLDKIFGLAYEEKYNSDELSVEDLEKLNKNSTEANENVLSSNVLGSLPSLNKSINNKEILVVQNSYRHAQEFRFIHHQLLHSDENGNQQFLDQIKKQEGWFDYRDAIREDIQNLESNEARQTIPLNNTFEFQWNNKLTRKKANKSNFLIDGKYLKDNFSYEQIGYFDVSQGILLKNAGESLVDKLTRLYIRAGYNARSWSFGLNEYFVHQEGNHIFSLSAQKRFDMLSLISVYNENSFEDSSLRTLKAGAQIRPVDVLGFSLLREHDLDADENISTIYQLDFMPNNNCWIINLNYRKNVVEDRFSVNYVFNFGNDEFKNYRNNYFDFNRLSL